MQIYEFYGARIGKYIKTAYEKGFLGGLEEIRLRDMRPVIFKLHSGKYVLMDDGSTEQLSEYMLNEKDLVFDQDERHIQVVTCESTDIKQALDIMSHYSLYAFNEEIKNGFITLSGGHRVGICGQAVVEDGVLKTIKNISFLNFRAANQKKGVGENIYKHLFKDGLFVNTLILSPPGYGKTTLLRDLVRIISNKGHNITLIDERSEIAACYKGVPQNDVGICTDVFDMMPKKTGILTALRAMSPEIIAVDEINKDSDLEAVMKAADYGSGLICTMHADKVPKKSELNNVFKRYIRITADRKYIVSDGCEGLVKEENND